MALTANGTRLLKLGNAQRDPYVWGSEDCSELFWDIFGKEGFGVSEVVKMGRTTANDYCHMGVSIPHTDMHVGAFWGLLNPDGKTYHHIGIILGPDANGVWWTLEARGAAYGLPKRYRMDDPVNGAIARGAKFFKFPHTDLGPFVAAMPYTWVSFRTAHTGNAGLLLERAEAMGEKVLPQPIVVPMAANRKDGTVAALVHASPHAAEALKALAPKWGIVVKLTPTDKPNTDANMAAVLATE